MHVAPVVDLEDVVPLARVVLTGPPALDDVQNPIVHELLDERVWSLILLHEERPRFASRNDIAHDAVEQGSSNGDAVELCGLGRGVKLRRGLTDVGDRDL